MTKKNIIIGIIITMVAGTGIFYSCQKDRTLDRSLDNISYSERKKKKIEIRETLTPGQWYWLVKCTDKEGNVTYHEGYTWSRKDARKAARGIVCSVPPGGNSSVSIISEDINYLQGNINALVVNGHIEYLEEINPWTNEFHRFTQGEISVNALAWLSEICFYDETLSQSHELVVAQLKVWNVYLGGNSVPEIISLHQLTTEQFNAIAKKTWKKITIEQTTKENETIHLDWNFEY
jgi:hypothetical protein